MQPPIQKLWIYLSCLKKVPEVKPKCGLCFINYVKYFFFLIPRFPAINSQTQEVTQSKGTTLKISTQMLKNNLVWVRTNEHSQAHKLMELQVLTFLNEGWRPALILQFLVITAWANRCKNNQHQSDSCCVLGLWDSICISKAVLFAHFSLIKWKVFCLTELMKSLIINLYVYISYPLLLGYSFHCNVNISPQVMPKYILWQ